VTCAAQGIIINGCIRDSDDISRMMCQSLNPEMRPVICAAQGIIINGCIRDSDDISRMPLGVKALNTFPLKSSKRDPGLQNVPIAFGGVNFKPGDWVYADKDGILVSPEELKLS
jgi:regulator of RNase E activity RraA